MAAYQAFRLMGGWFKKWLSGLEEWLEATSQVAADQGLKRVRFIFLHGWGKPSIANMPPSCWPQSLRVLYTVTRAFA